MGIRAQQEYERRLAAFEEYLKGPMRPPGADRLILDMAFKAGWEAHKASKKQPQ